MMGRALLTIGWTATVGFAAAGWVGYEIAGPELFNLHLLLGLAAAFLLLFSHCWIMFYLIGTGKAIKEAAAEANLGAEPVEETKALKNRSYPSLMLAMALAMATFILGGGVDTGSIPVWLHHAMFVLTLGIQLRSLWILRINAACRAQGISYSRFIDGLKKKHVELDRKMLSELAVRDARTFQQLVDLAKQAG